MIERIKSKEILRINIAIGILFMILMIIAMFNYPGGTYVDTESLGYDFFNNYFSDLGRLESHSGRSNLISFVLFSSAIIMAGLSLVSYHYVLKEFLRKEMIVELGIKRIFITGVLAGLAFIGIAITPSDIINEIHMIFVGIGFSMLCLNSYLTFTVKSDKVLFTKVQITTLKVFAVALVIYMILFILAPGKENALGLFIRVTGQKIIIGFVIISYMIQNQQFLKKS